ncbi:hypothetical protein BGX24_000200, partial [Mortierella sp. AD032]
MVVIGIGLGDFSSKTRLTSLHGSFISYFVGTARALGYIVVGRNEFYTSKKCPRRPRYLQPVDAKGHYPWEEECDCGLEDNTDSATKDVTKSDA